MEPVVSEEMVEVKALKVVAKRLVLVAFVMTEEEAKMFWEKRLRKRRVLDPRERVMSVVGRMSARVLRVL